MAKNPDFRIYVGGRTHELCVGDITPALAMEVRRATGLPLSAYIESPREPDSIGVFVWLARRLAGEIRLDLNKSLTEFTLDNLIEGVEHLEELEAARATVGETDPNQALREVAADPETLGADS